jgi:hypothetical protein
MSMLISQVNVAPDAGSFQDDVTHLQIVRQKMVRGSVVPLLYMLEEDGPYSRYLVELNATPSPGMILKGGAQLVVAAGRIAGLIIRGEFWRTAASRSIKLNQNTGQMICFSINCDELGPVAIPTKRRDKATAIHFGSKIKGEEYFRLKIYMAEGFLNSDGTSGRTTIDEIAAELAVTGLAISRGTSLY